MGFRADLKTVFGKGGAPAARPSIPSTSELEKRKKQKAAEEAASKERSRRHRFLVARKGGKASIPFD